MKIAGVEVGEQPLILAPMEDVTNPPFRKFCKRYGADWLYSEFVSADALVRSVNKSLKKLVIVEKTRFSFYSFWVSGETRCSKRSRGRFIT